VVRGGCIELNVRKRHKYVSVFWNLIGKRVLFSTPGEDKGAWARLVGELDLTAIMAIAGQSRRYPST
jgi:hypothetical protein